MMPTSVAIIGAGTMGAGIAITTLCAGLPTVLIDRAPNSLAQATARLEAYLARAVAKGRMDEAAAQTARGRLVTSDSLASAAQADLVIEAVFEKLEIKTALLRTLEPLVRADCLLATNTSCLRVSDIAEALARPERFFGLHYFSPAEINPVVEVVLGDKTDLSALPQVRQFLEQTGKVALPCKDRNGFAINRFFCPYVNEAVRCLQDGLGSTTQIDAVAAALFGQSPGPFATMNLIGPPVMLHALENLAHLGPFYAPAAPLRALVEAGGQWPLVGAADGLPHAVVGQIQDRLRAALYLPISELLAERVASPADIDMGARQALRLGLDPASSFLALSEAERALILEPIQKRYAQG